MIRAEASADDRYAALDLAIGKLLERLRRDRDRRKDHRNHTPIAPVDVRPPEPELEPRRLPSTRTPRSRRRSGTPRSSSARRSTRPTR